MSATKRVLLVIGSLLVALLSVGAAIRDRFVGDLALTKFMQRSTVAPWEETMELATLIGQTQYLIVAALVLIAWFFWRKQKAESLVIFGAVGSLGISLVVKMVVDRPRPADDLVMVWRSHDSASFPSGHATNAVIMLGLLYYLAPLIVPWNWAIRSVRISSVLLIALIGTSRVYLGAHWPSDVLGGVLYGSFTLAVLIYLHRSLSHCRSIAETKLTASL